MKAYSHDGGGLIWHDVLIVIIDDYFNSGGVHGQRFAEGAGFALFVAHEAPQLIQFQDFPFFMLCLFRPPPGRGRRGGRRFFLAAWQSSSALRPSRGQCCAANYVPPAGPRPGRTAPLWPRQRARTAPASHRLCTGSAHGRRCDRCGEFPRCRILRNSELS